jgi:hypothetical protein
MALACDAAPEAAENGAADSDAAVRALIGSLPERQRHAVEVLGIEIGSVSATPIRPTRGSNPAWT